MNIIPLNGVDEIQFGVCKQDIQKLLGKPDIVENLEGNMSDGSEIYMYISLGFDLYFDQDSNFRLWGISITGNSANLFGVRPIGLTDKELLNAFPSIKLDVCDGIFKEFSFPEKEIDFFLKNNIVKRIMVNPSLNEYCKKYSK